EAAAAGVAAQQAHSLAAFQTADNCMACHNGLTAPSGEDVSFGVAWRASMMANSARDPYWQAAVRREVTDHPKAAEHIEDECATCHMPMSRTAAVASGQRGRVFAHLPLPGTARDSSIAADGVSCTMCHQISAERAGSPESFTGGFVVDMAAPLESKPLYGPFSVDGGRSRIMHSATGYKPTESAHVRQAEFCASCHTLYTTPRGPDGEPLGKFPEQVPYLEWRHSAFRSEQSCQACHMPVIPGGLQVSSVLGEIRTGAARHDFRGGNFFMLRMLNRYRAELGVEALPQELESAARLATEMLQAQTARISIMADRSRAGELAIDVDVSNLTGHKLPTAYPSRRVWIHLRVRTGGDVVFESGSVLPSGAIAGNDNDAGSSRYEPHYREIRRPDQVQIYESILGDRSGRVTTGLISAVAYLKDNRLLPRGFEKSTAGRDIAPVGDAREDPDFIGETDRVRYVVPVPAGDGEITIEAALMFQPIGFRWADNLRPYPSAEPQRFVRYFDSMAASSSEVLARATARAAR
ncbi:MAG TPA: hypothetical protein VFZ38_10850, partial [Vicinamibacterales bacterium]